jgi:hydroxymethylpyrimidine pyrophosphatase-like HAD family hydrolase
MMHLTVLASDLDGTLAEHDQVAAETWAMLRQAKAAGLVLILVTGRTLADLPSQEVFADLCEAIVAENGAVVYFPRRDVVELPFGRVDATLLAQVQALAGTLPRGLAIAATPVPHDKAILKVLHDVGGGATLEYNCGAVMVLPLGATKGTGLHYALHQLGYSPHNVVACGNAENDRSLFEMSELAVAVGNAAPEVQILADVVLGQPNGAGVQSLIATLLNGSLPRHRTRSNRQLSLGYTLAGEPVHLDPFELLEGNLVIFGDSLSGKSWLAGLLAEEVLKQGNQSCINDQQGDYRGLRAFPHSLVLGGATTPLPPVVDVITFLEYGDINLVLDLSLYPPPDRTAYLTDLLRAVRPLRARRGRPHWFLVDEVQHFCPPEPSELTDLLVEAMPGGGFSLVSYRPSQVAPQLLAHLDHWLLTRLPQPEEIKVLTTFLARCETTPEFLAQLPSLPLGQAYLCARNGAAWELVTFQVGKRAIPHIRHLHKYLQAPLPTAKRFYFHAGAGQYLGRSAASLWEFREALDQLPLASLRYHLQRGDFENWLLQVLHDKQLAHLVKKMRLRDLPDEALRQALLEAVSQRYEELENLT